MPKTSSDFTAEQRQAVVTADRRLVARRVVDLAAAGELAQGCKPFRISASTVVEIRRKADEQRRVNAMPREEALDLLDQDIVSVMARALEQIEADAEETGKIDLSRLRQLTGVRKNMREANLRPATTRPEQDSDTTPHTPALLARLALPHGKQQQDADQDHETAAA